MNYIKDSRKNHFCQAWLTFKRKSVYIGYKKEEAMSFVTLQQIKEMPKVELHRHADGAVNPKLVWRLLKKEKISVPQRTAQQLGRFLRIHPGMPVEEIMAKFETVLSVMQSRENIELVFCEQVLDLARENIVYAELRFAPEKHRKKGLSLEEVIKAALRGIRRGMIECKVRDGLSEVEARLIVCIDRKCKVKESKPIVQAALAFKEQGVVGIDLVCNEILYPPELHTEAYELTFESNIGRTAHAGEFGDNRLQNIKTAQEKLKVHRLGHALEITKRKDLLGFCRKNRIGIEICPVSNVVCGNAPSIESLELDVLKKEKVLFNISSDDPALFHTSLSGNLYQTAKVYKWSLEDLKDQMRDSLKISFLSEEEKQRLLEKWF